MAYSRYAVELKDKDNNVYGVMDEENRVSVLLLAETIPDTTQTISFDSAGNVSQIVHKDSNNNTVRADVFTFGENTITEVRTLNTGDVLTIVTNTDNLVTTVTYTAAQ